MEVPANVDLPFFAYGAFRPGELAFHRLKPFVIEARPAVVVGQLRIRDGLPIVDPTGSEEVPGILLRFRQGTAESAYRAIVELEPDKQYVWGETVVSSLSANVLWGRWPKKGSIVPHPDEPWNGQRDPLFTSALEVVQETLEQNERFEWDLKPLFRLQMAYLLLWSAIERYLSLRYHLGDAVWQKVKRLAEEPAFAEGVRAAVQRPREVFRADNPEERVRLAPEDPAGSLEYYYQVRSNITHRGKAAVEDHDRLRDSLRELLAIFGRVLKRAFEEAAPDA